jgi:hypothetical protein
VRITPPMIKAACEAMGRNGLFNSGDHGSGPPDLIAAFATVRDALMAGGYAVRIDPSVVQGDERLFRSHARGPV